MYISVHDIGQGVERDLTWSRITGNGGMGVEQLFKAQCGITVYVASIVPGQTSADLHFSELMMKSEKLIFRPFQG